MAQANEFVPTSILLPCGVTARIALNPMPQRDKQGTYRPRQDYDITTADRRWLAAYFSGTAFGVWLIASLLVGQTVAKLGFIAHLMLAVPSLCRAISASCSSSNSAGHPKRRARH